MAGDTWNIAWGEVIVTATLALITGLLIYHFTSKAPDLVYEEFPPAQFTSQAAAVSIYNVAIDNIGSKEVSDVKVNLVLPTGTIIQEIQIKPSSSAIDYEVVKRDSPSTRQVRFPLLNPGESARFSLLVNNGYNAHLTIDVRGIGVVGRMKDEDGNSIFNYVNSLFAGLGALLAVLAITWLAKFTQLQEFLQRSSSQQLQALRTQNNAKTTPKDHQTSLPELLTNQAWRLFFNPRIPGLAKSKIMLFGADGIILEGKNENEARWRIRSDFLELINDRGGVHGRFYYSPADHRFYSTNDPDVASITTHAIRDQYLMPEAPASPSA
jgi:hypothetical protein